MCYRSSTGHTSFLFFIVTRYNVCFSYHSVHYNQPTSHSSILQCACFPLSHSLGMVCVAALNGPQPDSLCSQIFFSVFNLLMYNRSSTGHASFLSFIVIQHNVHFVFFFPVTVCTTRNLPHILPNTNVHFFLSHSLGMVCAAAMNRARIFFFFFCFTVFSRIRFFFLEHWALQLSTGLASFPHIRHVH